MHVTPFITLSDTDILTEYRKTSNSKLLGEIFNRHTGFVFAVCMKYLQDKDAARDATMHIFERLISDLKTNEVQNLKPWLHVVAKNYCFMQHRAKKFETVSIDTENFDVSRMESNMFLHHDNETNNEEQLSKLENALELLSAEQKECIRLFYLEEKCYKEIETITGYDYNQIKSYIQNGKRNLKNLLVEVALIVMLLIKYK